MDNRLTPEEYCDKQWDQVKTYIDGVRDDSIVVGSYIKKIVDKYVNFIQDKKYAYRIEKVDKVFKFFSFINTELKNQYTQFPLLPWQSFILAYIFGFYQNDNIEKRLVRETFLFVGRKNGKTNFASAIQLYGLLGDGVNNPQSLLLANTSQQAGVALSYAKDMVNKSKALRDRLVGQRSRIVYKDSKKPGFCQVFATSEPARLEGFSPSLCLMDEIHAWTDNTIYQSIKTGVGARLNPMIMIISTAGSITTGFCNEYLNYHKNILDKKINDDSVVAFIYQPDSGDDLGNDKCWYKANPSLGIINSIDDLHTAYNQALYSFKDKFAFVTKNLNIFWDSPDVWIPKEDLVPLFKTIDKEKLKGKNCFVGIDLSRNTDLSSVVLLFPPNEDTEKFHIVPYFFMANREGNMIRKNGKDLSYWINKGHIIKCASKVIDLDQIYNKIIDLSKDYNIVSISYDPFNAPELVSRLKEYGHVCEPFRQNASRFNAPLKIIENFVYQDKLVFDNNPVMLWMFENVVLWIDGNANIKIIKNKMNDSVDGVVAAGMAFGGFVESTYGSEILGLKTYIDNI